MNRDTITVAALWAVLTVIGEALVIGIGLFPAPLAEEAKIVDEAFEHLVILGVPVFTFVVSVLVYAVIRFRRRGAELEDGPPVRTHGKWVAFWFAWTTALTVAVIIHPGVTGLRSLTASHGEDPDLLVKVTGQRWLWTFEYPEQNVTTINELVIPVDKLVRFEVTAPDRDVLHSFWIPAFRIKIDAVPGLVTHTYARATRVGAFEEDVDYRVQCAELCGLAHGKMAATLSVVSQEEFEQWAKGRARVEAR
ncbi:MAG: cytochrome c oxidase subunit II [Chloroflexi bacterium]|nr:cytochrome c oxidase subunit II [Chloroflexota bacterium]